jgi:hypothetical protein
MKLPTGSGVVSYKAGTLIPGSRRKQRRYRIRQYLFFRELAILSFMINVIYGGALEE